MTDEHKPNADEFLAAPDEVVKNPREAAKLRERKSREKARKARERNKQRGNATLEDILADVVRVAEDEAVNPFWEHRSLGQRRYELHGNFYLEEVLKHGRFAHVKQMAGLEQTEGDRRLLAARTEVSKRAHAARYVQRYLLPHVDKFPELRRAVAGAHMALAISDTHSAFMDPFYWNSFLAFAGDAEPDLILLIADHIDGSEISTHPKVPKHTMKLQAELDIFRAQVREIREVVPATTRIVLVGDNHFFDRLVRYLTQVAPALAGLRSMRVDNLMGLGDLEVELVMGGAFVSPEGQEDDRPFARIWDRFNATHGTRLGKYPAALELASWNTSGVSGHVHKDQIIGGNVAGLRREKWMSLGSGVIDPVAKYYVRGAGPAWTRAWGIIEMLNGSLQFTSVDVTDGYAMAHGWYYEAPDLLPAPEVATVRRYWLERFGVVEE